MYHIILSIILAACVIYNLFTLFTVKNLPQGLIIIGCLAAGFCLVGFIMNVYKMLEEHD